MDATALAASLAPRASHAEHLELGAPFGIDVPAFDGGALYVARRGACSVVFAGRSVRLASGHALFLPLAPRHELVDAPGSATTPMDTFCRTVVRARGAAAFGGDVQRVSVVSLGFLFEARRPWVQALPPVVFDGRQRAMVRWLLATCDLLKSDLPDDVRRDLVGTVMRTVYTVALCNSAVRAPCDDRIAAAYSAMVAAPQRPWTVERLAAVAGMSRSAFAALFAAEMGEPTMAHVRRLRAERARALARTGLVAKEVAARVGYAHARSLARALKRTRRRSTT